MQVHRVPLSVQGGGAAGPRRSIGRGQGTKQSVCTVLTLAIPLAPGRPRRRAAPRRCARESVAFVLAPAPGGVPLSARPSVRLRAPSPSTSRLPSASEPRTGRRPASRPSPPSTSNYLRPITASPLLPPRCQAAGRDPEILAASACSAYLREMRVTDGTRTRTLRSHNPLSSVSGCCRALQNRFI